jgi:hypothetical protein
MEPWQKGASPAAPPASTACGAWIASSRRTPPCGAHPTPLIVDLGYGAARWTSLKLLTRLRLLRPDARVIGIEIDPERVRAAAPFARDGLCFARGRFEVPLDRDARSAVIRAANVLRQYDDAEVPAAWALMRSRLQPGACCSKVPAASSVAWRVGWRSTLSARRR